MRNAHAASIDQSAFNFENPGASNRDEITGIQKAIIDHLRKQPSWYAKAAILAATNTPEAQWKMAIDELIAVGKVEKQGEKRGTRYRAVNENGEL